MGQIIPNLSLKDFRHIAGRFASLRYGANLRLTQEIPTTAYEQKHVYRHPSRASFSLGKDPCYTTDVASLLEYWARIVGK